MGRNFLYVPVTGMDFRNHEASFANCTGEECGLGMEYWLLYINEKTFIYLSF